MSAKEKRQSDSLERSVSRDFKVGDKVAVKVQNLRNNISVEVLWLLKYMATSYK